MPALRSLSSWMAASPLGPPRYSSSMPKRSRNAARSAVRTAAVGGPWTTTLLSRRAASPSAFQAGSQPPLAAHLLPLLADGRAGRAPQRQRQDARPHADAAVVGPAAPAHVSSGVHDVAGDQQRVAAAVAAAPRRLVVAPVFGRQPHAARQEPARGEATRAR